MVTELSEYKDSSENERTYTKRNYAISEFVGLQEFAQKITQGIVKMADDIKNTYKDMFGEAV